MPLNDADKAWIEQAIASAVASIPAAPSPGDVAKAVGALEVRVESKDQKAVSLRAAVRETFEKVTGR